ncbi:hypothetical protein FVR03_12185 [Pontibacter qinzhouensis]|uniref:DUF4384 domain-containing protein n=1 Tax=Pontibacter qinzhouensis TaxID=2603253 RepID=A0A5C8K8M3_9BACT|nr:DUF6515 family protein [Pontibacter qinzhouensis]TXK45700.1 hypothetical protein FVR03_12185 [Pontibacter qinzhouensis]
MKARILMSIILTVASAMTGEALLAQNRRDRKPERVVAANHRAPKKVVVVRRPVRKVVVRKAHTRYLGMPRWGATVTALPASYITISFGDSQFFYHNGVYYSRRNGVYVVTRPVRGVRVQVLPVGFRAVPIGPRTYYYYYGTYYLKAAKTDEYIVVNAPEGAVVDALPEGYEIKVVDGNEYYFLDGVYYAEVDAPEFDDKIGYQVVTF